MKEWVVPYVRKHKGLVLFTLILGLLGLGSGAMLLFTSGYLISKSSLQPVNIMIVYVPIVAVRAFSIGQAVFLYLQRLVGHDIVLRILEHMRTKLYRIVEPQALFLRSRFQSGNLLGVLSEDIEHLQDLYLRTIFPSVLALLLYSILIVVFGFFDIVFALMMSLMLGVVVFLIPFLSLIVTRRRHIKIKRHRNQLYALLTDAAFGLMDWKASGRTNEFLRHYERESDSLQEEETKVKRWQHIRDGLLQLTVGLVIVAVMYWSSVQADKGVISATVIAGFVLMIMSTSDSLTSVSHAIEPLPAFEDSISRIQQIEKLDVRSVEHTEEKQNEFETKLQAGIQIDNLSYRYPEGHEQAFEKFSLQIEPKSKTAILGKSGTGKSTLLKLLAGVLKPSEGTIRINGLEANRSLLGTQIAVLNQKPHLFDTSVGNNVRIGRPEASDEEVWSALEQAQIAEYISSLPQGLDTPMREMGGRFSGGERQRIAFARILLQNTPVFIFDEPTIGLDPNTEHALLKTMLKASKEKTVIWVTHHLAHIEKMDNIIFLQDGKIAMQGTHEKLMKTNEKYNYLYTLDKGYAVD